MNDYCVKEFDETDRVIIENYKDIGDSIYKGSDPNNYIFVDMKGDFELLRIFASRDIPVTISVEEYNCAVLAAINDAIDSIKNDRVRILDEILSCKIGEN